MYYIALMDAYHPEDYNNNEAIPVANWQNLSEDEQADLLNSYTEAIGMLVAGAYEADNPHSVFNLAMRDIEGWIHGCVA